MKDDYQEWIKELPFELRDSITTYTGSSYSYINGYLRTGKVEGFRYDAATLEKLSQNIEAGLLRSEIKQDVIVYRGMNSRTLTRLLEGTEGNLEKAKGLCFSDKGFVSTCAMKEEAFGGEYLLNVHVPKGTKGAYVEAITDNAREFEVLLNKGQMFEIIEARKEYEKIVLDVVVVGK
jgi:hypothetical protein